MLTITVLIATHNRADLLRTTLEHLRRQEYQPGDEVIVVDNASTDTTPEVIAHAATGFPVPLRQRHDLAAGKAAALNNAIASVRGDVLALTDDDVIVAPDWIATIRRLFTDPSIDLIGGRVEPRWERPAPAWLQVEDHGHYGPMSSPLALLHYGEGGNLGHRTAVGANMAIRRAVFEALGGFAPHLGKRRGTLLGGEDHDLCQRAVAEGYQCEYRPELRVQHWVPAERTRLRYFLRWFVWSGITHALIAETADSAASDQRPIPFRYLCRQLLVGLGSAPVHTVAGRPATGAAHAMEAAYALGYLGMRLRNRWRTERQEESADEQPIDGVGRRTIAGSCGEYGDTSARRSS